MKMLSKVKIDIDIDVQKLKDSLDSISSKREWDQNQISLQHRKGVNDHNDGIGSIYYDGEIKSDLEFCEWYDDLEDEYIVQVLKRLPFNPYRVRIMNIKPKRCYSMHADKSIRFHIPVDTAEDQGRFIFDDCEEYPGGEILNLSEGSCTILNTKLPHTAMNCNKKLDRIHIVGCMEEKEETENPFMLDVYEKFGL